jgi:hypothetical protein
VPDDGLQADDGRPAPLAGLERGEAHPGGDPGRSVRSTESKNRPPDQTAYTTFDNSPSQAIHRACAVRATSTTCSSSYARTHCQSPPSVCKTDGAPNGMKLIRSFCCGHGLA